MGTRVAFGLLLSFILFDTSYAFGLSEDGRLNFIQLANKYGYTAKEYLVITEDGYILKLFHILGKSKVSEIPVLLMHGLLDTSDTWLVRGNGSLGLTLADKGYDVWFGNCRGNKYGRKHIYLDPNTNDGFWDFSFHEFGFYDLPAIIDTVLHMTGAKKINGIGHSQGNAIFYVLASTKPEYNDKVNVLIALAPICFLQNVRPPLSKIIEISPEIDKLLKILNVREILGDKSLPVAISRTVCPIPIVGYNTCILGLLFPFTGYDIEELEAGFVPTLINHFPDGTSEKDLIHFAQVSSRRKFANYDYGRAINLQIYNSTEPPEYDLSAVTMAVALLVGPNDKLSTVEDVAILREKLPNVIKYLLIPRRRMNHVDFVIGQHMEDYLFPYVFDVLKYRQ